MNLVLKLSLDRPKILGWCLTMVCQHLRNFARAMLFLMRNSRGNYLKKVGLRTTQALSEVRLLVVLHTLERSLVVVHLKKPLRHLNRQVAAVVAVVEMAAAEIIIPKPKRTPKISKKPLMKLKSRLTESNVR